MAGLTGHGTMALLELDPESAEALIADYPGSPWRCMPHRVKPSSPDPRAGRGADLGGGRVGRTGLRRLAAQRCVFSKVNL